MYKKLFLCLKEKNKSLNCGYCIFARPVFCISTNNFGCVGEESGKKTVKSGLALTHMQCLEVLTVGCSEL